MRRAIPALVITLTGLGALATFKSSAPAGGQTAAPAPATTPAATAPPDPTADGAAANVPASTTTTPTTANTTTRTVDGDPFDNRFGTVQVRVTLSGSRIVDVTALQLPNDRDRSAYISEQAGPYLRQEALQAQSAQIDVVSGATYTSDGYARSLQSALDKAKS